MRLHSLRPTLVFIALFFSVCAFAAGPVNIDSSNIALRGIDPVGYFNEGKPVPGKAEFSATHQGATYRFASAANRDAFMREPDRYTPQYGGYCAYAAAIGSKADGDPNQWKVVDNKLYLNLNAKVSELWNKDVPGFIRKADENWPRLADK